MLGVRSISQKAAETSATVSSTPVDEAAASAVSTPVVPPDTASADVVERLPDLTDAVVTHGPAALQYGDLAALGLTGWTPAGFVRWTLEIINVATGLPWFWTIVAGSLFWKLVLVPISITSLQNSARLLPIQPEVVRLQKKMELIRVTGGSRHEGAKTAMEMRKLYKSAGVNILTSTLVPFIQLPITLGVFFGVRKMCDLPLPQLTASGLDILPDLTVADPYFILPALLCAVVNLQIHVSLLLLL